MQKKVNSLSIDDFCEIWQIDSLGCLDLRGTGKYSIDNDDTNFLGKYRIEIINCLGKPNYKSKYTIDYRIGFMSYCKDFPNFNNDSLIKYDLSPPAGIKFIFDKNEKVIGINNYLAD